jgi:type III secretory pathway component EscV
MESVVDLVNMVQRVCEVNRVLEVLKEFLELQVSMEP